MTASFDNIEIVANPGTEYFKKMAKEVFVVQNWSYTEYDYDTWLSTFHKFWFFVAIEKDTNEPVACVGLGLDEHTAVTGEPLYSIGMYFVSPKYRGTGLGLKLWDVMIAVPEKDANIVMYAAVEMGPKYAAKYGFVLVPCRTLSTKFFCKDVVTEFSQHKGIVTKDVTSVEWSDVKSYENTVNPRPHPKFLKKWMVNLGTYSRIAYDIAGKPIGICCLRADVGGDLCCGPFYAENLDASLALLWDTLAMIDLSKYNRVRMLYHEDNKDIDNLVDQITAGKFETVKKGTLQFNKKVVEFPKHKVYSIADVAMGLL